MREKIIVMFLLSILSSGIVYAEQTAAEEYRTMFQDGNFYLEFKDKWGTRIIASKNGTRMERMNYTFEHGAMAWLNPLGAIFGGTGDKNPEVMYKNGKYYYFVAKNKANVCSEENLQNENLDPRQGWNKISQKLSVPNELAVFFWNDPYRSKSPALSAPKFSESLKKTLNDKQYDCDRYICGIKELDGHETAQLVYDMLYKDGQLFRAETYILRNNVEYPVGALDITKIQRDIPEGTFKIYKGTRLYAAGTGDIDDLLEKPKEIGAMEDS